MALASRRRSRQTNGRSKFARTSIHLRNGNHPQGPLPLGRPAGGAADARLRLRPRNLINVSQLDTRIKLFGRELPFPILLAPVACHRLFHPEGEIAEPGIVPPVAGTPITRMKRFAA
ncbi:MAG: hypothetical protein EXS32_09945 [Opitutus sp.]|nr:hypothetical protein [Opitutus sp.]